MKIIAEVVLAVAIIVTLNSELCEECVHKANNSNAENKELLKEGNTE